MAAMARWSDQKNEMFKKVWELYTSQKCKLSDVAEAMNCSEEAARHRAKSLGLQTFAIDNNVNEKKLKALGLV